MSFKPRGYLQSMAFVALAANFTWAPAAQAARPFQVRDSIQIADFIEAPVFSPDGRHFVTVTQRGVLPQGVTEATLWLFETAEVPYAQKFSRHTRSICGLSSASRRVRAGRRIGSASRAFSS